MWFDIEKSLAQLVSIYAESLLNQNNFTEIKHSLLNNTFRKHCTCFPSKHIIQNPQI